MGISKILFQHPEMNFAEWMASHELNRRVMTEPLLTISGSEMGSYLQKALNQSDAKVGNISADLKSKVDANSSSEYSKVQQQDIEKLRKSLGDLQTRVNDLFRCPSVFAKEKGVLSQAILGLNHSLQTLVFIREDSVLSIAKDLMKVIELLKTGTFSTGAEPPLTLEGFKIQLREFKSLAAQLAKSYGDPHLTDQFYDTREAENFSLTSEVQPVVKLPEAQGKFDGKFLWKSHFEVSSEPTEYYLINGWLVVSTVSPSQQIAQPSPLIFRDGDEPIALEIVGDMNKLPPDHLLRKEIIKSIKSWNKLQIKKMQTAMLTFLVGAGVLGSIGLLTFNPKFPLYSKIAQGAIFLLSFLLGYCSILSGVVIYDLYTLRGRIAYIGDLGLWVKQVRAYVRKYPGLAQKHPAIQKFFTQNELAWAKNAIDSSKSVIKA
ncbi:MAG: hypothetical protein JSS10_04900 [Verrucomicrobia bacterium]|nr:hypothetical protein [Verrucomicrobiota bacterium]